MQWPQEKTKHKRTYKGLQHTIQKSSSASFINWYISTSLMLKIKILTKIYYQDCFVFCVVIRKSFLSFCLYVLFWPLHIEWKLALFFQPNNLIQGSQWTRRVWKYQRGNQSPQIEEEQTAQWSKRNSTKGQTTIYKTKDRVTRTPLKTGINSGAPEGKQFLLH